MQRRAILILLPTAAAAVLSAQTAIQEERHVMILRKDASGNATYYQNSGGPAGPGLGPVAIQFMGVEMSGPPVKGAPYSAQGTTETTQVLADGNRIRRTSSSAVYRDGEGRTRREQTLAGLGPLAPAEALQAVFIMDPVAGMNYVLDPRQRTATKTAVGKAMFVSHTTGAPGLTALPPDLLKQAPVGAAGAIAIQKPLEGPGGQPGMITFQKRIEGVPGDVLQSASLGTRMASKTEDLGKQMMEGVEAEGTRTVMTIAAGEIGNERPIEVVSERWYSPDLQIVVMTRNSDPRMGETVYRLTGISRAEPPQSLFAVPSDYTVQEPDR